MKSVGKPVRQLKKKSFHCLISSVNPNLVHLNSTVMMKVTYFQNRDYPLWSTDTHDEMKQAVALTIYLVIMHYCGDIKGYRSYLKLLTYMSAVHMCDIT